MGHLLASEALPHVALAPCHQSLCGPGYPCHLCQPAPVPHKPARKKTRKPQVLTPCGSSREAESSFLSTYFASVVFISNLFWYVHFFYFLQYYLYPQIIFMYMRFVFYIKTELVCMKSCILGFFLGGEVHEAAVTVGKRGWSLISGHNPVAPGYLEPHHLLSLLGVGGARGPGQPLCQEYRQWLKSAWPTLSTIDAGDHMGEEQEFLYLYRVLACQCQPSCCDH